MTTYTIQIDVDGQRALIRALNGLPHSAKVSVALADKIDMEIFPDLVGAKDNSVESAIEFFGEFFGVDYLPF